MKPDCDSNVSDSSPTRRASSAISSSQPVKPLKFQVSSLGEAGHGGRGLRSAALARLLAALALVLLMLALPGQSTSGDSLPQRIISLAPSITETLFALGLGPKVVGVSRWSDFPPAARKIKKVGSFLVPSVEAIVAEQPDLVIVVPSPGNRGAVDAIERMGIKVKVVKVSSLAQTEEAIRAIGEATGTAAKAERLVGEIHARLGLVRERLAGAPVRKVLVVVGRSPLIVAGPQTFLGELVERARGLNVAPAQSRWPVLNIEMVIAADPEVIIDTSMGSETRGREAASRFWRSFPSLRAVRNNMVVTYSSDRLLRPGPRLDQGLSELARLIHPERF